MTILGMIHEFDRDPDEELEEDDGLGDETDDDDDDPDPDADIQGLNRDSRSNAFGARAQISRRWAGGSTASQNSVAWIGSGS